MIYHDLIMQEKIWTRLNNYAIKQKIPNAFLFYGDNGCGKEAHAIEFAALINCDSIKDNRSCGKCNSCKKIKKLQHGNVKLIHPLPTGNKKSTSSSPFSALTKSELEDYQKKLALKISNPYYKINLPKANSILINSIRLLKKDLLLSNIEKGWNIVIVLDAEKLCYPSNVSANALLKILEEPPSKTLFILTTSSYSKIIDTIKSRCQNIFFPKISNNKLNQFIKDDISDIDKEVITNISNGNINLIKQLEESIDNIYNDLKLFINACYSSDYKYNDKITQKVSLLKRNSETELLIFFRIIMVYFKDLFVFSESKDIKYLIYKKLDKHYYKITKYHTDVNWNLCIEIIDNTLNNIYRNASIPLSINGMLIEIHEVIMKKETNMFNINEWLEIE